MARPRMLREDSDPGADGTNQMPPTGMPNPKELQKKAIFLSVPTLVHPGTYCYLANFPPS